LTPGNEDPFEEMLNEDGINWAFMDAYRAALQGGSTHMEYENEELPAAAGNLYEYISDLGINM